MPSLLLPSKHRDDDDDDDKDLFMIWWGQRLETLHGDIPRDDFGDGSAQDLFELVYGYYEDDHDDINENDDDDSDVAVGPNDSMGTTLCSAILGEAAFSIGYRKVLHQGFSVFDWFVQQDDDDEGEDMARILGLSDLIYVNYMKDTFEKMRQDVMRVEVTDPPLDTNNEECSALRKVEWKQHQSEQVLPLYFLTLADAEKFGNGKRTTDGGVCRPPSWHSFTKSPPKVDENEHDAVRVFVSHRWDSRGQPNFDKDWDQFCSLIDTLIRNCIAACVCLKHFDFPLEVFFSTRPDDSDSVLSSKSSYRNAYAQEEKHECESDTVCRFGSMLVRDVLRMVARKMIEVSLPHANSSPLMPSSIVVQILRETRDCIWLWYDYCSLPQRPLRNEQEETALFRATLSCLADVQLSMHTILLNSTQSYYQRAWCVAEWMNAEHSCSLWNRDGFTPGRTSTDFGIFQTSLLLIGLWDAQIEVPSLFKTLEFSFTDDEHEDEIHLNAISWIFWNACHRNTRVITDSLDRCVRVASGGPSTVFLWLKMISKAIGGSVDYGLEQWVAIRKRQSDPVLLLDAKTNHFFGENKRLQFVLTIEIAGNAYCDILRIKASIDKALPKMERIVSDFQRDSNGFKPPLIQVYLQRLGDKETTRQANESCIVHVVS
jgi:hypothetical protein